MAVRMDDLIGTWDMVHDDWVGVLTIDAPDQRLNSIDGACAYSSYVVDGTYVGVSGATRSVRGWFQGRDGNWRRSQPCPSSNHKFSFTIDFDPVNPQPFEGYLFTWERRRMAGFTWWVGIPFGWYAKKR